MRKAANPIPVGWCSDPSIVRVGEDYYIASSTFEWMPGVMIFHSRDLINWERLPGVLQDSFADLEGLEPSCAIWAPNLTYSDGLFYLAYTIVYSSSHRYKDTHNFLITAERITGPWSAPVELNRIGFDPSIFHDDDGKKYVVSQTMEYRTSFKRFRGVTVQEYDPKTGHMKGEPVLVFEGTDRGVTEGPNIMKKDGYYYITAAEGGTSFGHCVTIARSKSLFGPYEVDPENPMLSSTGSDCVLQRAGHGQFFNDTEGNWYMAHLCARPLEGKWSILGRECAIQNIDWKEGEFPRIKGAAATSLPLLYYEVPDRVAEAADTSEIPSSGRVVGNSADTGRVYFKEGIPNNFMTLRRNFEHRGMSLTEREGFLRIHGGNSLCSHFKQGVLARNFTSLKACVETKLEFEPKSHLHLAGLVLMYNAANWYYLAVTLDEEKRRVLSLLACENGEAKDVAQVVLAGNPAEGASENGSEESCEPDTGAVVLGAYVNGGDLQFYHYPGACGSGEAPEVSGGAGEGDNPENSAVKENIGPVLDMRLLSDEHVNGNGFTAAMCGVCCEDLRGDGISADFEWFTYRNL